MELKNFTLDLDNDGIATLIWDMSSRSMNVIDQSVLEDFETVAEALENDEAIKAVIFTSGKDTFSGGADLGMLEGLLKEFHSNRDKDETAAMQKMFDQSRHLSVVYRRLETAGKPVVCALNGTALGGAFELALSCHYRVASENPKARFGLPEVKVGLFPGAGGTQRICRMLPHQDALQMLLKGTSFDTKKAKAVKLLDEVVPQDQLIDAAKAWIKANPKAKQPWDKDGFKFPGGKLWSPGGIMTFTAANGIFRRETYNNYPGGRAILQCVYEGLQVPMDVGLRIESRYFANVLRTPAAAAMIRSLFVSMQDLNKGARRPQGVEESTLNKVGIIGAGFMGAGVAYVTAKAGIEVVLVDRDQEAADKGKAHSEKLLDKGVKRNKISADAKEATLARITATPDYQQLADCDLVIEAVFEDREVKRVVTEKTAEVLGDDAIFASNTSTLPITSLAETYKNQEKFIGIHFFSPVDKMMLVELILGEKTSDKALAVALDYCRAIKKTPIVVNDSRGFYTSRVVGTYVREGHLMLQDGIPPAMVENIGRMAGMPVGPLSLNDEVAIDLGLKIYNATKKDLGEDAVDARQGELLEAMVIKHERLGRKNGKGFYDYHQDGSKTLWPGLADMFETHSDLDSLDVEELKQRLLAIQALETARCFEEGVLTDVREADVGSILGFGFAPFAGGTLTYIDQMGVDNFVALCESFTEKYGDRFKPNKLLVEMAKNGETFYAKFNPKMAKAA